MAKVALWTKVDQKEFKRICKLLKLGDITEEEYQQFLEDSITKGEHQWKNYMKRVKK